MIKVSSSGRINLDTTRHGSLTESSEMLKKRMIVPTSELIPFEFASRRQMQFCGELTSVFFAKVHHRYYESSSRPLTHRICPCSIPRIEHESVGRFGRRSDGLLATKRNRYRTRTTDCLPLCPYPLGCGLGRGEPTPWTTRYAWNARETYHRCASPSQFRNFTPNIC